MSDPSANPSFIQPTTSSISARIRRQRTARSLTLQDIERLSAGRIKAVVMGSYERGSRAISLARAIEIANLFSIPLTELIEEPSTRISGEGALLILDLRKLRGIDSMKVTDEIAKVRSFANAICAKRRDWNGEVLTLRSSDLDTLTLVMEMTTQEVNELLKSSQLLINGFR
jgi:transcriptional regulator with XRE-family HTH domain